MSGIGSDRLEQIADRLLDGEETDWESLQSEADGDEAFLVRQFLILDRIRSVHAARHGGPGRRASRCGHLEIRELIGEGAYGEVYRAWDPRLERYVALKLLHEDAAGGTAAAAIVEEARLLARVRHPNVAVVHAVDRLDGRVGIEMELVEGRTLEEIVEEQGALDVPAATSVGIDVCRAAHALHAAGILHRDIKANNVVRDGTGRVVLTDLGAGQRGPYGAQHVVGTPLYVAPEILAGEPPSVQSDVYSIGVLLFHLLTGLYPVDGDNVGKLREAHAAGNRRQLREVRQDISSRLAHVIERALDPDPRRRFHTASDLGIALEHASRVPRAWLLAAAVAVLVIVASLVLLFAYPPRSSRAALEFQSRDWVLVAIENETGRREYDSVVRYALERELSGSPYVNVVPRERINDALRLMRRAADSRLDEATAREVCLRDGSIKALIAGRVTRVGEGVAIETRLVRPEDGAIVEAVGEQAREPQQVVPAVRRLSDRLRAALGDVARSSNGGSRLAHVTTPSFRALQLFSRADAMIRHEQWAAAEPLLRQAIVEDATFAAAYTWLAYTLDNQDKSRDEMLRYFRRGFDLANTTTDRERYFLQASYYSSINDNVRAFQAYDALLAAFPDHYYANLNVAIPYVRVGRTREAAEAFTRVSDSRPNSLWEAAKAAEAIGVWMEDRVRAQRYFQRARRLVPEARKDPDPSESEAACWLDALPAFNAWLANEPGRSRAILDNLAARTQFATGVERDHFFTRLGHAYLALGRASDARRMFARLVDDQRRRSALAVVDTVVGNARAARTRLAPVVRYPALTDRDSFLAVLTARNDLFLQTNRLIEFGKQAWASPPHMLVARGELAAAKNRPAEAAPLLQQAVDVFLPLGYSIAIAGADTLARCYEQLNDKARAVDVLERVYRSRGKTYPLDPVWGTSGASWLLAADHLARLYRRVGRRADADAVERNLVAILSVADGDFPLLVDIRRRMSRR